MSISVQNTFGALKSASAAGVGDFQYFSLEQLEKEGVGPVNRLPVSLKILLEAVLRHCDGFAVTEQDIEAMANWSAKGADRAEIPFKPARVILQDFTGVPALVDLAAMREAMKELGGDPSRIQPQVPVDLVIDHSVQIDAFGNKQAIEINERLEFERNRERYQFLKWGQSSVKGFRVVPPAQGIVHQVNLEYLGQVTFQQELAGGGMLAYPDSVVGTDSHTPMINGLGVVGWGVGGIEAEAVMLGQPIYMLMPDVIGFKLTGKLPEGATATDMVLTITRILREKGVVGTFVEFFGPGLSNLPIADRATISNMSPEHGCTISYFPIDEQTLNYMRLTGRPDELVALTEAYTKEVGIFRTDDSPDPEFTDMVELDLSTVEPCMAGPRRPQDQILLSQMKPTFEKALTSDSKLHGFNLPQDRVDDSTPVKWDDGADEKLEHGSVVIASITSCTNTSNPSVMLAAGLVAKKAVARGLKPAKYVKTSLAPGSTVVTDYLEKSGLLDSLEEIGFDVVAYGCTTCIGNSGPLPDPVTKAIPEGDIVAASVLSGNRNFEGRVHALTRANYLASPPLVVAYALAGTVDIDLANEAIGQDADGNDVFLKDIWPTNAEVREAIESSVSPEQFRSSYAEVWGGNEQWNAIKGSEGELYAWEPESTYIRLPPFFVGMSPEPQPITEINGARCLLKLGDSVTTDHISPAGGIAKDSQAAKYLNSHGVERVDFNSYGSRRGNHEVMMRGTFANIRLRNELAPGTEGSFAPYLPTGEVMSVYEASQKYIADGTPTIVLGGKEYGSGSSRDWAAKGPYLLGIKAVIAESYERIHRSNLIGMGVLPLQYKKGESAASLGLTGKETFDIAASDTMKPGEEIEVIARAADGTEKRFTAKSRIDTPVEVEYYRNGGILHTVIRKMCGTA